MKPASGLEDILRPLEEILEEEIAADEGPDPELAEDLLSSDPHLKKISKSGDSEVTVDNDASSLDLGESATKDLQGPLRVNSNPVIDPGFDSIPEPFVNRNPTRIRKQPNRLVY